MGFIFPAFAAMAVSCSDTGQPQRPNILLIVADDLGMGDVNAYAPYDCAAPGRETISTPNIDSLAHGGILFLNGYSTSATSTPSRYAMFTGMYPWKNPQAKILNGDAPLLIPVDIPTLPKMLQAEGYTTGAIGKWHLGMGDGDTDWNRHISPDANTVGFDYTCLIAATNDRVPTVYVENGLVENLDPSDPIQISYSGNFSGEPTAVTNPELVKMRHDPRQGHDNTIVNGIPRIGFMKGGHKARWVDEEMADYFAAKTRKFIDSCSVSGEPFFLYYGLHEPHVPRAPHPRFAGSTGLGPRGDAVAEADWCVGEIIRYLSVKGLLENTLVIFTSDNGPVINDGYLDGADANWQLSPMLASTGLKLERGAVYGSRYLVATGMTADDVALGLPTFELQLLDKEGRILRHWPVEMRDAGRLTLPRTVVAVAADGKTVSVRRVETPESPLTYSIMRNNLYTLGDKNSSQSYGEDTPLRLADEDVLVMDVNPEWRAFDAVIFN